MKAKRPIEKLTVIREAVDYLTLRINANADICRYLDKLNAADSVRVFENPNIKFVHETEIVGKLHVLRILDSFGNSIGSVQFARPGAIGFFSELHLKGNFWFIYGEKYISEFLELFERKMDDEVGIVSIDYCFDVSEDVQIVEKLFQKITGEKSKKQPKNSEHDTWQSINTRRMKTKFYDKKLDIIQKIDTATGKRKYDLTVGTETPYRTFYNAHETITRIEQTRKGEAMREQRHSISWYLSQAGIRSLTLEDLEKKGIGFEAPERQRIRYEKRNDDWKNLSESILKERKEHSKKMFLAYAKSLQRFGMLENEIENLTDLLTIQDMIGIMDRQTKKEFEKIFY